MAGWSQPLWQGAHNHPPTADVSAPPSSFGHDLTLYYIKCEIRIPQFAEEGDAQFCQQQWWKHFHLQNFSAHIDPSCPKQGG